MKHLIFIGILSFLGLNNNGFAQNLVPNASFEQLDGNIKTRGSIAITETWFSPTDEKAEIFSPDSKVDETLAPANIFGKEKAKTGTNYAGFIAYSYKDKTPRSYLSTELSAPMVTSEDYCVSMYVSQSDLSKYAVSNIGALLTKMEIPGNSQMVIENASAITNPGLEPATTTMYWERICGVYTAEGGEKYLTIGNFSNSKTMTVKKVKTPPDFGRMTQLDMGFYYLDDVSVTPLGEKSHTTCQCGVKKQGKAPIVLSRTTHSEEHNPNKLEEEIYSIVIVFKENSLEFDGNSEAQLNSLLVKLQLEKSINLKVIGHVNTAEKTKGNGVLAAERAEKVYNFLVEKGIAKERLQHSPGKDFEKVGSPSDPNYEEENRSVIFDFLAAPESGKAPVKGKK